MSNAVVAADKWLYGVLAGDATLIGLVGSRIYGHVVPPGAIYPLVYFTMPGAADNLLTLEANRVWSTFIYAARIINKVESYAPLEPGASAIETALSRASGINSSGVVVSSVYESPFALLEIDKDGFQLRQLGGLFRLQVQ